MKFRMVMMINTRVITDVSQVKQITALYEWKQSPSYSEIC